MKQTISGLLLLLYLFSQWYSYRILIDFYMFRDYYTLNYCENLDSEITGCRASCFLEKQLKQEGKNKEASSHYVQQKNPVIDNYPAEVIQIIAPKGSGFKFNIILPHILQPEYPKEIFHPPKA